MCGSSNRAIYAEQLMQNAAGATGNGTAIDVNGYHVTMLQVDGISGDTITVEATINNVDWDVWPATNSAGTAATTITADGLFQVAHYGVSQVRARISTYSAGAITVLGRAISL